MNKSDERIPVGKDLLFQREQPSDIPTLSGNENIAHRFLSITAVSHKTKLIEMMPIKPFPSMYIGKAFNISQQSSNQVEFIEISIVKAYGAAKFVTGIPTWQQATPPVWCLVRAQHTRESFRSNI